MTTPKASRSKAPRRRQASTKRQPLQSGQPRAAHNPVNDVRLRGRLAAVPESRSLPSGDEVVTLRVIVDRPPTRHSQATVDTIDCTIWRAALGRRAESFEAGEVVEVEGHLRRRFWRAPTGARSRYDVEVTKLVRVRG